MRNIRFFKVEGNELAYEFRDDMPVVYENYQSDCEVVDGEDFGVYL